MCEENCCEDEVSTSIIDKPTYAPFDDLRKVLPKACQMLNVKSVDDVSIINYYSFPRQFMQCSEFKDKPLETSGVPGLPWVANTGKHDWNQSPPGQGLITYQCRGKDDLNYALYSTKFAQGYQYTAYIMPKGKVSKIVRHFYEQEKKALKKNPPILEEGLLEGVVNNTVGFISLKDEIEKYEVSVTRGIMLMGSPGNGKTMACRWIQRLCLENNIDYGIVSGAEMIKKFNDGKPLDEFFTKNTLTFFDDIDVGFLIDRKKQSSNTKMVCAMLSAMDGIKQAKHAIRIFTTNEEISNLDPAFVRPGRIDKSFFFDPPSVILRERLVNERWPEEIKEYLSLDGNFDDLIQKTDEFSFAELEAIRTILVTNKLLIANCGWDIDLAFEDFYKGKDSFVTKKKKSTGFIAA